MVPFAESDFIYASLGEELGMAGLFVILLCYLFIFQRGIKTAQQLRDGFGTLLATGLSFTIALQVFVVVGGVTRLIPLTGLTTPFLAQGGSSSDRQLDDHRPAPPRISDNARRPVEEFHTGVLKITEPRAAPTTSARGAGKRNDTKRVEGAREHAVGDLTTERATSDDAPTTNLGAADLTATGSDEDPTTNLGTTGGER